MSKRYFSFLILILSIVLLIYTYYRSEFIWLGSKRDYYDFYYYTSLALIIFSIISFFFNEIIYKYLLIISLSTVTALYSFELYLIKKNKKIFLNDEKNFLIKEKKILSKKSRIYKIKTGKDFDKRTKFEIYKDLLNENNEIVLQVAPVNYLEKENLNIFPLSGISHSNTIQGNENGYYSIYKSDRYGFNNPDTEWGKKNIEYFLVGDSFLQGCCVNRPYDIASSLRAISKKNVLNLGYGGNGPLMEYAVLREYLNNNVKNVLWFYYEGNDLSAIPLELNSPILKKYLDDRNFNQDLKSKQNKIDKIARSIIIEQQKSENKKKDNSIFLRYLKLENLRSLIHNKRKSNKKNNFQFELYKLKKILELSKNLSNEKGANFYFVYLPTYSRYKNSDFKSNFENIKIILEELNIKLIDIHKEVFKKEKNPLELFPFEMLGHYNIDGYKKISETVHNFLTSYE